MKYLFVFVIGLCTFYQSGHAQATWKIVVENDTLTEVGREVLEFEEHLYVINRTRCQPNAQSCGILLKYNLNGDLIWRTEMPDIKVGNDNIIHSYSNNIIVTGRPNDGNLPLNFAFYELDTTGILLNLNVIDLPYQSNFNYGSLVKGDTLYMYGSSREDITEEGINVDALIVTYDLVQDTFSYEYFDYGHDFVDIWDMRMIEDGSILFYSSHRRSNYTGDSLDWVVERLWPDGHRTTVYNQPHNSNGGVSFPQMEYLGDGLIALHFPNENNQSRFYPNIRVINLEGEVLWNQNYDYVQQNVFDYIGDIRKTNEGDILICGRYYAEKLYENDLSSSANAFISKMTKNGNIEWLRHFRTEDEETGEPIWSGFSSMLSLSDNSIVAVGNIERAPSDLLIIKLDENGCFGPDDCGGGVVTDVEEVIVDDIRNDYKIYPNPITKEQPLRIEVGNAMHINGSLYVHILDTHGRKVIDDKIDIRNVEIDISSLASGVYFLVINDKDGKRFGNEKLVVL